MAPEANEIPHIDYKISSTSPTIPKLLDQLAYAFMTFDGNPAEILGNMFEADPACFIAQALASAFTVMANFSNNTEEPKKCEEAAEKVGGREKLTGWEAGWLEVVCLLARLHTRAAVHAMMDMLAENPHDVITMFIAVNVCLMTLDKVLMRDVLGRVMPAYSEKHPYRGIMDSFMGFAMLETSNLGEAEKLIAQAIERDPTSSWTIHANSHLLEYVNKYEEGVQYMERLEPAYQNAFKCHLVWHKAIFLLGIGREDEAYTIFKDSLLQMIKPGDSSLHDAFSLLWRLRFEGFNVPTNDFGQILEKMGPGIFMHTGSFTAFHANACYLGAGDVKGLEEYQRSLDHFLSNHPDTEIVNKFEDTGKPLMKSMKLYSEGDYAAAAKIAYDVRDGLLDLGGSEAQKDFMHYMLFHSLKNCNFPAPQMQLKSLLWERSAYRELAPPLIKML